MFKDREEAGQKLVAKLAEEINPEEEFKNNQGVILAIPRGGIIVGRELASKLNLPLDVLVTKKLPAPNNPELAIGAIGEEEMVYYNQDVCQSLCITDTYKKQVTEIKRKELEAKKEFFRKGKSALGLKDKVVILTDDGVATGATIIAAVRVIRTHKPSKIIVAVPVVALDTLSQLQKETDQVIFIEAPAMFFSVSQFYQNFAPVSDWEVQKILNEE